MDSRLEGLDNRSYTLDITDLKEKHGFRDGDLFENLIDLFPELPERTLLLEDVIKNIYLPKLTKPIKLRRANSSHNPIRIDGNEDLLAELEPQILTIKAIDIIKYYGIDTSIEEENERVSKELNKSN